METLSIDLIDWLNPGYSNWLFAPPACFGQSTLMVRIGACGGRMKITKFHLWPAK